MGLQEIFCPKCHELITRTELPVGEAWHPPCYRIAEWGSCKICGVHINMPRKGQQTCGKSACKKATLRLRGTNVDRNESAKSKS